MCVKSLSSALALRFAAPFKKTLEVCGGDRRGSGRTLGSDTERKGKPVTQTVSVISAQAFRRQQDLAWLV